MAVTKGISPFASAQSVDWPGSLQGSGGSLMYSGGSLMYSGSFASGQLGAGSGPLGSNVWPRQNSGPAQLDAGSRFVQSSSVRLSDASVPGQLDAAGSFKLESTPEGGPSSFDSWDLGNAASVSIRTSMPGSQRSSMVGTSPLPGSSLLGPPASSVVGPPGQATSSLGPASPTMFMPPSAPLPQPTGSMLISTGSPFGSMAAPPAYSQGFPSQTAFMTSSIATPSELPAVSVPEPPTYSQGLPSQTAFMTSVATPSQLPGVTSSTNLSPGAAKEIPDASVPTFAATPMSMSNAYTSYSPASYTQAGGGILPMSSSLDLSTSPRSPSTSMKQASNFSASMPARTGLLDSPLQTWSASEPSFAARMVSDSWKRGTTGSSRASLSAPKSSSMPAMPESGRYLGQIAGTSGKLNSPRSPPSWELPSNSLPDVRPSSYNDFPVEKIIPSERIIGSTQSAFESRQSAYDLQSRTGLLSSPNLSDNVAGGPPTYDILTDERAKAARMEVDLFAAAQNEQQKEAEYFDEWGADMRPEEDPKEQEDTMYTSEFKQFQLEEKDSFRGSTGRDEAEHAYIGHVLHDVEGMKLDSLEKSFVELREEQLDNRLAYLEHIISRFVERDRLPEDDNSQNFSDGREFTDTHIPVQLYGFYVDKTKIKKREEQIARQLNEDRHHPFIHMLAGRSRKDAQSERWLRENQAWRDHMAFRVTDGEKQH